jgi:RNA polymerase sigma-70 factor (ECF subfamily)
MIAEQERLLVEQARRDPAAFATLYDRYFPRIYAYVRHRSRCRQDAEDLVAEVFLQAIAALDRFTWRHETSFASWLFRIAHNRLANFYRQAGQQAVFVSLEMAAEQRSSETAPEEFVLRDEAIAALQLHLRSLSPRRQEIVALRFFGALRNREIATVLDLDERTVAAHLSRALLDLQRRFREAGAQAGEEDSWQPMSER